MHPRTAFWTLFLGYISRNEKTLRYSFGIKVHLEWRIVSCMDLKITLTSKYRFSACWIHPQNSPSKNTGVGCHSLLQGIFLTQGLNLGLLHCRQILYCLSCQDNSNYYINRQISICLFHLLENCSLSKIIQVFYSRTFFIFLFRCHVKWQRPKRINMCICVNHVSCEGIIFQVIIYNDVLYWSLMVGLYFMQTC